MSATVFGIVMLVLFMVSTCLLALYANLVQRQRELVRTQRDIIASLTKQREEARTALRELMATGAQASVARWAYSGSSAHAPIFRERQ